MIRQASLKYWESSRQERKRVVSDARRSSGERQTDRQQRDRHPPCLVPELGVGAEHLEKSLGCREDRSVVFGGRAVRFASLQGGREEDARMVDEDEKATGTRRRGESTRESRIGSARGWHRYVLEGRRVRSN